MHFLKICLGLAVCVFSFCAKAEIDENKLGKAAGYRSCLDFPVPEDCKVGVFSNPKAFPYISMVKPSINPVALEKFANPPKIQMAGAFGADIPTYLSKHRATGLMILKDGKIVSEHYQYGRQADTLFRSFSMSKTITALLVGIALDKGLIESIDDKAEKYLPEIAGTVYGDATVRNLLRMSAGTNFNEEYTSGTSDLTTFYTNMYTKSLQYNATNVFNKRSFPQGSRFKYSTSDTVVLSRVLARATQKTLTQLTQEWLWEPMGAEGEAYWIVLPKDELEDGGGGFFATLKDYAKLGILMANDGFMNGQQIVPKQFLLEATDSDLQPRGFKKGQASYNYFGYGYQTWIMGFKERTFSFQGIYGQNIFVQPSSKVVMVQTSVYEKPSADPNWVLQLDLFKAAVKALGGNPY
jgi:CubicO group peptidase (beta-lactamase class C family)